MKDRDGSSTSFGFAETGDVRKGRPEAGGKAFRGDEIEVGEGEARKFRGGNSKVKGEEMVSGREGGVFNLDVHWRM